jgi:hypothetical protein
LNNHDQKSSRRVEDAENGGSVNAEKSHRLCRIATAVVKVGAFIQDQIREEGFKLLRRVYQEFEFLQNRVAEQNGPTNCDLK